ncbi:hypothetical protein MHU86_21610 [Fragilaria crotonensis]|nr:hypothetical protein MHU86_21610 [Fragilaria crotonensis]
MDCEGCPLAEAMPPGNQSRCHLSRSSVPNPKPPFLEQYEIMKTFLDSAVEEASNAVLAHCEALIESGTMSTIEASGQMQALAGDAFKFIAEKARANVNWKAHMVPVCRHNGTPIWVKSGYEAHYEV